VQLAALSGAPILPAAARLRRRLILKTWDRMILPLPFGSGAIVCQPAFHAARDRLEDGQRELEAALTAAAARADDLCSL
jgi:lysophospholipid acyltransferase (LPLAT)-like uncharacterized protein